MLFPDQATAFRAIGMVGTGVVAAGPAEAGGASPDGATIMDSDDRRAAPGLHIDALREQVSWNGTPVPLTRLERGVLRCLATEPAQVWPYRQLYQAVWEKSWLGDSSTVHAVVKRLRRKLRAAGAATTIESVRGIGFRLAW